MMNGLQAVEGWRSYFGEPKGATLGLFNAAYPIGGLVGIPFISRVNDRFGRRWGIAIGAAICIIGAALQAAAQNITMFVVSRGILGTGAALIQASGTPLITEIAHPHQRATATALFNTSYALGSIIAAWTCFGTFRLDNTWSWRIPSLLQGLPSVIQLAGIFFIPESPRWLVSRGRDEDALRMLAKYHGEGDESDALVQFEFNEIRQTVLLDQEEGTAKFLAGYLEFARTPGNRRRFFLLLWCACMSQMSGNGFVSYYLSPILAGVGLTSSLQQTLINATSQMVSWFASMYVATLPAKLGRRTLFLWSLIAVALVLAAIATGNAMFAQTGKSSAGIAVVVFIYVFSPAFNLGLGPNLSLYVTEIVPYSLRLRGIAIFQFWTLGFIMVSLFAIPVGLEAIGWKLHCVFAGWVVVEWVVVWFTFPETKGPTLEEIAEIFDGPGAIGRDV
ncbi:general substrate transporter [Aspergillus carlsbadensis]|nr:general substrate transporter [Aspergillus carlsbadensis]